MTPPEGWDEFARKNPVAPLSEAQQESYLNHLIDGHNDYRKVRAEREAWAKLPWWKRLFTARP